mmetsp:Transcript_6708/g.18408  ORF Transcript_6708/g.18408 Transcript_6708/m.18408 type:complete len:695 (-) Transcript_6708:128-2212(-)
MSSLADATLAKSAEVQAEELLALQEIFGKDCHVQSEAPGQVSFSLEVSVDLGLGDGHVLLSAEVPPEGLETQTDGPRAAVGKAAEVPAVSVADLVEQRLRGSAQPPTGHPRLERSRSGRQAHAIASVRHLPPITMQVSFPAEYPEGSAPEFHLSCEWLNSEQLAVLCTEMDCRAQDMLGEPVVFTWAELLRGEAASLLGIADTVTLAVSVETTDVRAVANCADPMASLLDLLQYNNHAELELWRQQVHQCGVCFAEKAGSQFVHLDGCVHSFCSECMAEMARVHVTEGSIVELKCPLPECRAEIGANVLERVLDDEAFERWRRLKTQQILTSELEDIVFCPRCVELGIDVPCLAEAPPASSDEAPVASCRRCGYMFCAKCFGVAHASLSECISEEDRMIQVAMRKVDRSTLTIAERRKQRRSEGGQLFEVAYNENVPSVDVMGSVAADLGPLTEGDEILSVGTGTKESHNVIWSKGVDDSSGLEAALAMQPPLVIRYRHSQAGSAERLRKKRVLEELMTLRAIKQDSQACPRCRVRISRSQGCNHMRCTSCDTHFCYRCGATIPAANPYSHFSAQGCPTFDAQEVRRLAAQERLGGEDHELEALRRQFGRQEELFAMFRARQQGAPAMRGPLGGRHQGDTQCPTCRQWNSRVGGLNAARCHACRTSYCHHCGRRILGVVTQHFRGDGACPQHGG